MRDYRYIYDNRCPKQKFQCPQCGKLNTFVRYIDKVNNEYLPQQYGICDRVNSCGYKLNPYSDGFANKLLRKNKTVLSPTSAALSTSLSRNPCLNRISPGEIPLDLFQKTLLNKAPNEFKNSLYRNFGKEISENQIKKYYIGTCKLPWPYSTSFPFIDINHKVRCIQIKLFDETMHTAKSLIRNEKISCTSWIHQVLKNIYLKKNLQMPLWLKDYCNNENKVSCLFGEHLLNLPENLNKPVAIVEAPKSAIIADIYYNKFLGKRNYVWLAAGSLSYLNHERCKQLKGRKVTLFPDLNAFPKWQIKAKELSSIGQFNISDLLETKASQADKEKGLDIADYLLKIPFNTVEGREIKKYSSKIITGPLETATNSEFNNLKIIWIRLKDGISYDILFNKNGELLELSNSIEFVKKIERFFNRDFKTGFFDDQPCWIHVNSE